MPAWCAPTLLPSFVFSWGALPAEVLPEWIRWHREFWPRHQQPADYAYAMRFPRILPFLGWDVSRAAPCCAEL